MNFAAIAAIAVHPIATDPHNKDLTLGESGGKYGLEVGLVLILVIFITLILTL